MNEDQNRRNSRLRQLIIDADKLIDDIGAMACTRTLPGPDQYGTHRCSICHAYAVASQRGEMPTPEELANACEDYCTNKLVYLWQKRAAIEIGLLSSNLKGTKP